VSEKLHKEVLFRYESRSYKACTQRGGRVVSYGIDIKGWVVVVCTEYSYLDK
jgi:hypothetical protein